MNPLMILLLAMVATTAAENPMLCGIVNLHAADPNVANVTGQLRVVQQNAGDPVTISGKIYGLTRGLHGFHIHEKGDLRDGCKSAGPHFNPTEKDHGGPTDYERHVGDLGNIEANNEGVATIQIIDNIISLTGSNSILGRAIVVHANKDDLGTEHNTGSRTTGNSGDRVACGIIGVFKI